MKTPEEIAADIMHVAGVCPSPIEWEPTRRWIRNQLAVSLRTYAESQVAKEREMWAKVVEAADELVEWADRYTDLNDCGPEHPCGQAIAAYDAAKASAAKGAGK